MALTSFITTKELNHFIFRTRNIEEEMATAQKLACALLFLAWTASASIQVGNNFPSGIVLGESAECTGAQHYGTLRLNNGSLELCTEIAEVYLWVEVFASNGTSCGSMQGLLSAVLINQQDLKRRLISLDTTAPTLELLGAASLTVEASRFESYVEDHEPGYTAYDTADGDITDRVEVVVSPSGTVDMSGNGVYTVEYSVSDSAGNSASQQRTVTVQDTIPPVVTVHGDAVVTLEGGDEYTDSGASAVDTAAGDLSESVVSNVTGLSPLDTSVVATYYVEYSATDNGGNVGYGDFVRVIIVQDTTGPVLSLTSASVITISQHSAYVEASFSYTDNTVQPSNLFDTHLAVSNGANVDVPGTYVEEYLLSDVSGNVASNGVVSRTVHVEAVDECSLSIHDCSAVGGVCTDTAANYTCECDSGFVDLSPNPSLPGRVCSVPSEEFDYTGSVSSYVVPDGVTQVRITAWGGAGGSVSEASGGPGGYASAIFSVTPGEVLQVRVGKGGAGTSNSRTSSSGGGGSGVRRSPYGLGNRLLVAGGGGGNAGGSGRRGGGGGGGASAPAEDAENVPSGATAGTQSSAGAAGSSSRRSGVGGLNGEGGEGSGGSAPNGGGLDGFIEGSRPFGDGLGGRGFTYNSDRGHGGGGGGYFGGGSGGGDGQGFGGGGGSGYVHSSGSSVSSAAGSISSGNPGGSSHPNRGSAGSPGVLSGAGNNGKVIIEAVA